MTEKVFIERERRCDSDLGSFISILDEIVGRIEIINTPIVTRSAMMLYGC